VKGPSCATSLQFGDLVTALEVVVQVLAGHGLHDPHLLDKADEGAHDPAVVRAGGGCRLR
jgi:hypothetical protein